MKNLYSFFLLLFCSVPVIAQEDSLDIHDHSHDSIYIVHENIPKNKFWGNSWYTGLSYNLSKSHEFGVNFGRTYGISFGSGGGFNITTISWGLGYSYYQKRDVNGQTISAFGEFSNFFLPPATGRVDYIYDLGEHAHYLRPSIGISFFAFDVLYNYSFKLYGKTNEFKHGLLIRFKYYINNKNWESVHPNRC